MFYLVIKVTIYIPSRIIGKRTHTKGESLVTLPPERTVFSFLHHILIFILCIHFTILNSFPQQFFSNLMADDYIFSHKHVIEISYSGVRGYILRF